MTEKEFKQERMIYRKQLFDSSFFGLVGLVLLKYAIENIQQLIKVSYFGYEYYTVPKILGWFFDKFGPMPTTIITLLLSIVIESYFVYRIITYRKNMKKLTENYSEKVTTKEQ